MVLGMNIEILFANVGYLANPQAKVWPMTLSFSPLKDYIILQLTIGTWITDPPVQVTDVRL